MKLKNVLAALSMAIILLPSCKKDDDSETTYLYFDGEIEFSLPTYVKAGDKFTFNIDEISTLSTDKLAEGESIGYYWTDPYTAKNDTLKDGRKTIEFTVKDTLGTFDLTIKGFLSGFVNGYCTVSFSTVNPDYFNGSLSQTGVKRSDSHFTDSRDGNVYYYTQIGDLLWTRNNLAYTGSGVPYKDSEVMNSLFGRFYTYDQAMSACPAGWRLPTDAEWQTVVDNWSGNSGALMVDARFNDESMWTYWKDVKPTNESKLGILPLGYATAASDGPYFYSLSVYAAVWTSTVESGMGVYRYIHEKSSTLFRGTQTRDSFYLPVRCVKEN